MGEIHLRISSVALLQAALPTGRFPPSVYPGDSVGADTEGRSRWFNKNVKYKVAGGDGRLGNK